MSSRPGVSLALVRGLFQGCVVLAFFVALNALAALLVLAFGKLVPDALREETLVWMAVGMAAIAAAVWIAIVVIRFIGRSPSRARAPGPAPSHRAATTSPGRSPSSTGS